MRRDNDSVLCTIGTTPFTASFDLASVVVDKATSGALALQEQTLHSEQGALLNGTSASPGGQS